MKAMTCKQLAGACDVVFRANTFDEIARLSQQHGKEMFQKQDGPHLAAMQEMQKLMKDPAAMQQWFDGKRKEFDALPERLRIRRDSFTLPIPPSPYAPSNR